MVIANQSSDWCTPGWSLLPCGQFTSWRSPGFEAMFFVVSIRGIPTPVCALARNDRNIKYYSAVVTSVMVFAIWEKGV